jgi:hypothetical protein
VDNLQSVAAAFIESYQERGDPLPDEVQKLASDAGPSTVSEVLIAV